MYNSELKNEIHDMFQELSVKVKEITENSRNTQMATERISEMIASRVSMECEGYIVDMYTYLVKKLKEEEYFKEPKHLNDFYKLNLREELNDKYHFEVKNLKSYKNGIKFKEVNKLYAGIGATAGTLAVGGILKYALSGMIHIPIAVIIAGAIIVGVTTYCSVPQKNRKEYIRVVNKFLNDMENEILDWLVEVEIYFENRVSSLYMG